MGEPKEMALLKSEKPNFLLYSNFQKGMCSCPLAAGKQSVYALQVCSVKCNEFDVCLNHYKPYTKI